MTGRDSLAVANYSDVSVTISLHDAAIDRPGLFDNCGSEVQQKQFFVVIMYPISITVLFKYPGCIAMTS